MKEIRSWKKVYLSDLSSLAIEIVELLKKPAVVFLSGEVGAGKTTFTQNFIEKNSPLNKNLDVSSPTYSIVNEIGSFVHADFYRLKSEEEIIYLELPLYTEDKDFIFIEWGKSYFSTLIREVHESFNYYELTIDIIQASTDQTPSRNFSLYDLSDEI